MTPEEIIRTLTSSKKYAGISPELLHRVAEKTIPKYKKDKEQQKAVKEALHQIYGEFFPDDCHKKAFALLAEAESFDASLACSMMELHISTRERLPVLEEFYAFLREGLGSVKSILDIGCGFNPLAIHWMKQELHAYYPCDIHQQTIDLANLILQQQGLPPEAFLWDAVRETPQKQADVAYLFKVLPVLEQQAKGRGFSLLQELNVKKIVVTYPTRSLGGRKKGMEQHYARTMEEGLPTSICIKAKQVIGNELIYLLEKQNKQQVI